MKTLHQISLSPKAEVLKIFSPKTISIEAIGIDNVNVDNEIL